MPYPPVVRSITNLLFALSLAGTLAAPGASAQVIADKTITANGVKLHYLVAGHGPAVILLHGFGETSHMWLPLIPKLAVNHTVVAPDLRGAGASDKPAGGYDKKTMAVDIHALAQGLGLNQVTVVGHDIGLMVAYAYAAQYPAEVQKIALMDAFLPGVGEWEKIWLLRDKWHFNFYGETPLKLVRGRERIYLDHFWNDFAADRNHSIPEADRRLYTAAFAQPGAIEAGMNWFKAFEQDGREFAELARTKLTMPMLVLAGEKSGGDFLINQCRLVDTSVQGVIIKGSGHWIMEEAPEQTIPALVSFVNQPGH